MNILEVKGASFVYSKGTPFEKLALDNATISFEKGKITGLTNLSITIMYYGLVILLPLAILIAGIVIWLRRRYL